MPAEIKHGQRHTRGPFHLHSSTAASLFSLPCRYFDGLCCQKHAGTGKGVSLPRTQGAGCPCSRAGGTAVQRAPRSAEAGQRWLQLLGTSRVLGADRGGKKVVLTCRQSRLERKLIGDNFIWNAEALFLEWLVFLLTTLEQTAAELCGNLLF